MRIIIFFICIVLSKVVFALDIKSNHKLIKNQTGIFELNYDETSNTNFYEITIQNLTFDICSGLKLKVLDPNGYGLVSNGEIFFGDKTINQKPQFNCLNNKISFLPLSDHFSFITKDGIEIAKVKIMNRIPAHKKQLLTRGSPSPQMLLNRAFPGCGLNGTILQRVYDCSKLIVNWGATVTPNNTLSRNTCDTKENVTFAKNGFPNVCKQNNSNYYTPFQLGADASGYWFVVACPSGVNALEPQQSCSYLTPEIDELFSSLEESNNKKGFFISWTADGHPDPSTFVPLENIYKKRILFGGEIKDIHSYWDAIGMTSKGHIPEDTVAFHEWTNQGVAKPSLGSTNQLNGICKNFNYFDHSTSHWLLPTYSMMLLLTGGLSIETSPPGTTIVTDHCPFSNEYISNAWGIGLKPENCSNKRFSAINIPGFIDTYSEYSGLYSASGAFVNDEPGYHGGNIWYFLARTTVYSGYVGMGSPVNTKSLRCVSLDWW